MIYSHLMPSNGCPEGPEKVNYGSKIVVIGALSMSFVDRRFLPPHNRDGAMWLSLSYHFRIHFESVLLPYCDSVKTAIEGPVRFSENNVSFSPSHETFGLLESKLPDTEHLCHHKKIGVVAVVEG